MAGSTACPPLTIAATLLSLFLASVVAAGPPPDSDSDGLSDMVEATTACLDPADADSDDDGLLDGRTRGATSMGTAQTRPATATRTVTA